VTEIRWYLPPSFDEPPVCTPGPDGRCAVCADEGTPGRVLELRPGNMAWVEMPDGLQEIAVDLIEDTRVGDQLLIHLGFAIARLALTPAPLPKRNYTLQERGD